MILALWISFLVLLFRCTSKNEFPGTKKSIRIESSCFSRKDNRFLAEIIMDRCSSARISASIKNMTHGRFLWYVF